MDVVSISLRLLKSSLTYFEHQQSFQHVSASEIFICSFLLMLWLARDDGPHLESTTASPLYIFFSYM